MIMPTIPSVYQKSSGRLQQSQMQMNNSFSGISQVYSFSKESPGLGSTLSGNMSLNNNAISIINAYAQFPEGKQGGRNFLKFTLP